MNILIVGNGFDLSHYLPTKYDHFMDVMRAIEEKNLGQPFLDVFRNSVDDFPTLLMKILEVKKALNGKNYEMSFDELFSKCREKWFIDQTKLIYKVDSIQLNFEKIIEIQYLLTSNGWYQYFKGHLKDIDTWIDFERQIEEFLMILAQCISKIESVQNDHNELTDLIEVISPKYLKMLNFFGMFYETGGLHKVNNSYSAANRSLNISRTFCYGKNSENEFNPSEFLKFTYTKLEEFIGIFNIYLELIVDKLDPKPQFKIQSQSWVQPDHIFSFNYTNSFQKFYTLTSTEFLHGRFGEKQNIVLGISDLEDGLLKKLKAYGFTKYHQKLFKDTDYLFLDSSTKVFHEIKQGRTIIDKKPKFFNFYVWGHSLDISDQEYVKDLFLFNEPKDQFVRITVFHFDNAAKFSLLNNLLAILGKDKVEQWMKNKWLTFEPNPEINFGV